MTKKETLLITCRSGLFRVFLKLVFLGGCGVNLPTEIEDRSTPAQKIDPEIRQASDLYSDYGFNLERVTDYTIEPGDTLYAVAFRLGIDYRELARLNNIEPPFLIKAGDTLKTHDYSTSEHNTTKTMSSGEKSKAPKPKLFKQDSDQDNPAIANGGGSIERKVRVNDRVDDWKWPGDGFVSRPYSAQLHKGIDLTGERGDPVRAAANGVIVYAGTGVTGYGALLIVKHNDIYLSAYGHNDVLLVLEGEKVKAGQTIAKMGSSSADSVKLHFEIRKNGMPVNPMKLLPQR